MTLDAEPAAIRRTYLRLLKTRKPEVDPEGFARLRDAYESLKAAQEGAEAPRTSSAPEPPPTTAPHQEATSATPKSAEQRLDAFRARFGTLPPDAPRDAPVQIAREAVAAMPDTAEARHWLIKALIAAEQTDEAVQAFRDAFYQGHPEFLVGFAQTFPHHLSDDEIALLGTTVPHSYLWGLAEQLGHIGEWYRAARVTLVAFDAMIRHPERPPAEPAWFLALLLRMHANGHTEQARAIQKRYAEWLTAEGLADAFLEQEEAWAWILVRELGALDDSFPPVVRTLLAGVVLTRDVAEARARFVAYREQEPERAAAAKAMVAAQCPNFHAALSEALFGDQAPPPTASSQPAATPTKSKPRWLIPALGFLAVAAVVGLLVSRSSPQEAPSSDSLLRSAKAAAGGVCVALPPSGPTDTCSELQAFMAAIEARGCSEVPKGYMRVAAHIHQQSTRFSSNSADGAARRDRLTRAHQRLDTALRELCPQFL